MYCKLTTQEKLKDLRVARHLTLKELSEQTSISSSTLSEYENNEQKDISSFSLEILSNFYGVSIDYLLGNTENAEEATTPIEELHLTDEAIAVLKSRKINTRLLSEIIAHENFNKAMIDAEIYVDRIAENQFRDMNALLETCRQTILTKQNASSQDLYMRTLEAAQIAEKDFFSKTIHDDIMTILETIREAHITDTTTADQNVSERFLESLEDVKKNTGSAEDHQMALFLKNLGIKRNRLTDAELVTLMDILNKSDYMKQGSRSHGRGKKSKKK